MGSPPDTFRKDFAHRLKQFVVSLVHSVDSLPNDRSCSVIGKPLLRSGTRIGANYFEARAASSRKDFANFFTHSLKSANESQCRLETLLDTKKCDGETGRTLLRAVSECANIFASSILTLRHKG
jgi:four helix bundle protein